MASVPVSQPAVPTCRPSSQSSASAVSAMGLTVYGGVNAPYLWVGVPSDTDSWGFFDRLLQQAALICTPGAGFGAAGEGYVRLTAFGAPEDTQEAIERLRRLC